MTTNEQLCIVWGVVFGTTIRGFIMKQIIARIIAWFSGDTIQKIVKCIPLIVAEVEKAMLDGKIDAGERKAIALKAVTVLAEEFGVKLNGLMKWVVGVIIDNIAKALPSKDIKIPDVIFKITKEW